MSEKAMVSEMIALYCRKNHHTHGKLCAECAALDNYARTRVEHCPFMETKTFCSNCRVHCYKPDMREKIRVVMRFSGPRMRMPSMRACPPMDVRKETLVSGFADLVLLIWLPRLK